MILRFWIRGIEWLELFLLKWGRLWEEEVKEELRV